MDRFGTSRHIVDGEEMIFCLYMLEMIIETDIGKLPNLTRMKVGGLGIEDAVHNRLRCLLKVVESIEENIVACCG